MREIWDVVVGPTTMCFARSVKMRGEEAQLRSIKLRLRSCRGRFLLLPLLTHRGQQLDEAAAAITRPPPWSGPLL